ncbi:hypothetical protein C8F04DRAFT_1310937, partial [Mycena alexandri]
EVATASYTQRPAVAGGSSTQRAPTRGLGSPKTMRASTQHRSKTKQRGKRRREGEAESRFRHCAQLRQQQHRPIRPVRTASSSPHEAQATKSLQKSKTKTQHPPRRRIDIEDIRAPVQSPRPAPAAGRRRCTYTRADVVDGVDAGEGLRDELVSGDGEAGGAIVLVGWRAHVDRPFAVVSRLVRFAGGSYSSAEWLSEVVLDLPPRILPRLGLSPTLRFLAVFLQMLPSSKIRNTFIKMRGNTSGEPPGKAT